MRIVDALTVVVVATGLVAGCGTDAGTAPGSGSVKLGALPRITSESQYTYPFDAYLPTTQDQAAYRQAFRSAVERCTESFGLDYVPVGRDVRSRYLWDESLGQFRIYNHGAGLVSEARAARFAYKEPEEPVPPMATEAPPPTPDLLVVVNGSSSAADRRRFTDSTGRAVPKRGCYGEALDRLGGAGPRLPDLDPAYGTSAAATGTQDYVRSLERWVACMKRRGHRDAESPQTYGFTYGLPGPPSVAETELALDDVACKRESRVADVFVAVRRAMQERFIERNQQAFDGYRRWVRRVRTAVLNELGHSR